MAAEAIEHERKLLRFEAIVFQGNLLDRDFESLDTFAHRNGLFI